VSISNEDISNRAIEALGMVGKIESLGEGSVQANSVLRVFQVVRQNLTREAQWNFAKGQITMTLLQMSPLVNPTSVSSSSAVFWSFMPWAYEYAYPSDCLRFQKIIPPVIPGAAPIPLTTAGNVTYVPTIRTPFIPWAELTDNTLETSSSTTYTSKVICCNINPVQGQYIRDVSDPTQFDLGFELAFVMRLAQRLALILGDPTNPQVKLEVSKDVVALGEAAIAKAKAMDGNESPTVQDHFPDFLRARMRSGWGSGNGWFGINGGGGFGDW
jgi:hypothetical protein